MQATLEELINSLYEMIQDAWSVPIGDKCLIEKDRALDILDEIRQNLPSDLKMARDIVDRRNDILAAGKRESEMIVKQAEVEAAKLVNDHEITVESRRKAADTINTAKAKSEELRRAASEYCDNAFKELEKDVSGTLEDLKRARQKLQSLKPNVKN